MSAQDQRSTAIITVKPTRVIVRRREPETVTIRTGGLEPESVTKWISRFAPAIVTGGSLAIVTWLLGLLSTGAAIYRELLRAGLIPHWIVGAFIALAPFLVTGVVNLLPLVSINRTYVAVICLGLVTGAALHCLGLLEPSPRR